MSTLITLDLGIGECGCGSSAAGFGEHATMNSTSAKLFIKTDGTKGECALIDPNTGDYVLDMNGSKIGDDPVNQLVYLALLTQKGSSAVYDFGIDLQQDTISDSTQLIAKNAVQKALKSLIDQRLVDLISVNISIVYDAVSVGIVWRDVTKNKINTFNLNG